MSLDLLVVFIAISVLILVHETGHFLSARFFKIWIEEFGIGLPPRVLGKKIGETIYSLNLLPIGGFVKLHGEEETKKVKKPKRAFFKRPWWQRSIILTAGVLMNFILAVVILSFLFTSGVSLPERVEIDKVNPDSPAFQAGFKSGDTLRKVDGIEVKEIFEVTSLISERLDKKVEFELSRSEDGKTITVKTWAIPRKNPPKGEGALGVVLSQKVVLKKYPFYTAPIHGLLSAVKISFQLVKGITGVFWDFLTGFEVPKDVAGPIGMYQLYGEARKSGIMAILELSGLISLNLAVINLFPIPPLDGSRLFLIFIERISGKKLKKEWEEKMFQVGFIFMIILFILVSIQDLKRLFGL